MMNEDDLNDPVRLQEKEKQRVINTAINPPLKYVRRIQANILCIDGSTFIIKSTIQLGRYPHETLKELDARIKEQFPVLLQRSLSSGFEVVKFNLL